MIQGIQTLVDGGIKIAVVTRELSPQEQTKVFELARKEGWMVFSESDIQEEDVPAENVDAFDKEKTPSQRLRSRMFVYYKETHKDDKGFNQWYADALDEIGQKYLDRLEEE
jgi:uncharacterized protein with ParB-like and HNH nuclease domain